MSVGAPQPQGQSGWSAPGERIAVQIIHWGVVVLVAVAVLILRLYNQLDNASVTALYGTILGHAGTSASQKLGTRSSDTGTRN